MSPTSPTSPTSPQGPISPPSEEDFSPPPAAPRAQPPPVDLSSFFDDAPILHLAPGSVYHAFRPPSHNNHGPRNPDALAITPSTTPPPNTPAIDTLRLRSVSKNPIAIPVEKPGTRSSVELAPPPVMPTPSTASPSSGVCYVCKQRVFDREGVVFRNVLVAITMEGITVAVPFTEQPVSQWRWKQIKQWSWNQLSFIVRLDLGGRTDQDVHFETAQADEILAAINYYVTLNLQVMKKEKEAEQLARDYAAVNNTPYKPPPRPPPGLLVTGGTFAPPPP